MCEHYLMKVGRADGWEGSEEVYISARHFLHLCSVLFALNIYLWEILYVKTNNIYFMILSWHKSKMIFIKENRNNDDYCMYTVLTSLNQMFPPSRTVNNSVSAE